MEPTYYAEKVIGHPLLIISEYDWIPRVFLICMLLCKLCVFSIQYHLFMGFVEDGFINTHKYHPWDWYIYLHLVDLYGKCR